MMPPPLHQEDTHVPAPASVASPGRVAILLCTYNGDGFLAEQLESIARQTHTDWVVYASDDGSTDATIRLLHDYQERLGRHRMVVMRGPCQGFAKNFLSLIKNPSIVADFYAFCDQDDVWFPDKLERSLRQAAGTPPEVPFLFCSRTRLVNAQGEVIGYSPLFNRKPGFHNALVQSLAGANTMLLNAAARDLLARIPDDARVVSHDWLTYLLVSGCGGRVVYDAHPTIDYRQHGANVIGSNVSLADRLQRIRKMLAGTFRDWNRDNLNALRHARHCFTPENRSVLCRFILARRSRLPARLSLLRGAGLYRQTVLGNIGLVVAASIRRI